MLFLIEDEATLAKNVQQYMQRHGWDVEIAGSAEDGLARIAAAQPDVVAIDFQLPGMDGLAAIAAIRERDPQARVVMITGQDSVQLAVDAMKAGAADFLTKPVALAELKRVLDRLSSEGRMRNALAYYRSREAGGLAQILGESPSILGLKERIRRVVEAEAGAVGGPAPPILVTGETGAGKELVARACHYESRRRDAPFIEINCAAIPANLIEAELFGYERGAFTDARERKIGLIEAADGGTLFLDEISEAEAATQAKLLKVLEDQRIRRLGSVQDRRVDVRVIAATNQQLDERVREGRFRADLLYRLRVIQLEVPPLRARGEDILLLAREFLGLHSSHYGKKHLRFSADAEKVLLKYVWPGNIRELRNVIEQTVLLASTEVIEAAQLSLGPMLGAPSSARAAVGSAHDIRPPIAYEGLKIEEMDRAMVVQALEQTAWNVTRAAKLLGLSRDTLRYRIEKYNLSAQER
jgi:DNA-binding NtrC family response regulator